MTVDPVPIIVGRLAVGWLFAHAAWHKLRAFGDFQETLARYRLLPGGPVRGRLVAGVAAVLVLLEIVVVIGAILGLAPALVGAAGLLCLYGAAMAANLLRDRAGLDCGCAGPPQPISWWLVARNLLLALLAAATLLPTTGRALGVLDGIAIGGILLLLGTAYAAANALHAARAQLEEWV
jgi:uncharacterized membrane protein YphA (DoxX/SURF4 family)